MKPFFEVTAFNPWPQCPDRFICNIHEKCLNDCSPVKGVILLDGRCPYDDFKPNRDIV